MIAAVIATSAVLQTGEAQAARHRGWHHHASFVRVGHRWAYRHGTHAHWRFGVRSHRSRMSARGWARSFHATASPMWSYAANTSAVQVGRASFYAGGGRTANGGFVGSATCAHRSLPFGTKVLVTNMANARQAVLTVNDRGPFVHGRLLDVSRGAAGLLGMLHSGVSQIRMQVLGSAG